MNLLLLADMAAAGGDGVAVQAGDETLTAAELLSAAWAGGALFEGREAVAYVGTNTLAFPIALFAAAAAGIPFVPLNYRLSIDQLDSMLEPLGDAVVVGEGSAHQALAGRGHRTLGAAELVAATAHGSTPGEVPFDSDAPAVLLYTSGTTSAPKAAVLRHRNLTAYVIGTVEFGAADPVDAVLVSVPPYHIAGIANLLSNLYSGRRIVYLPQFEARSWVDAVRAQAITHAMVVPTMLSRICDILDGDGRGLPSLRTLSYGGARTPATVLKRVMALLPDVSLTNAYGLTETSSTIAVLGPDDHRAAAEGDAAAEARLASVGRVLPTVEVEVRDETGRTLAPGEVGEIFVRGDQVSGEYATGAALDAEGWFATRDRGWVDAEGYLFIEGRNDDTIIRGGENIAPAEIEEVLLQHPAIAECAVVGVPDDEWGQRIGAAVVTRPGESLDADTVIAFARQSLRSSKAPEVVSFVESLPYTETGKLLRRVVQSDLEKRA